MRIDLVVGGFALAMAGATFALAPAPASAATFYVTTGLGTNVTTIGASTPAIWTFGATNSANYSTLMGAVVAIKHGPATTFGIQLQLLDMDSNVTGAVSYATVADFIGAGGQAQYAKFIFAINAPDGTPVAIADPFSVKFSLVGSGASTDETYSIRGLDGGMALTNAAPADIVVTDTTTTTTTTTPEPATAFILAAGLLGLGLTRLRRASPAAAS